MWNNPRALNLASLALVGLAGVLLVLAGLFWLSQRPMFNLRQIQVEAASGKLRHVSAAAVRAGALPRLAGKTRGNFFTVDLEAVRSAFESVTWVRRAQVRRAWPDRLVVRIEEHQPLGTWDEGRLVSRSGELFAANFDEAEEDGDLPALNGPPGSEKDVVARFQEFQKKFRPLGLSPIALTLSPRYAWTARFAVQDAKGVDTDIDLTVELGRERDGASLTERASLLAAAYPLVKQKWPRPRLIDLRYPNGFALRADGVRVAADEAARARAAAAAARARSTPKPSASAPAQAPAKAPAKTSTTGKT